MADVSWIKLSTDLFNNRKIKQIRKLPEGDSIIGVWLQLLCLAGNINNGGLIYFSKEIPYTDDMLVTEFERPINIIRLSLNTFETFEMLYIENDIFCVNNWEKYQSIDGLDLIKEKNKERQKRFRNKQKLLLNSNVTVTLPVTVSSISNSISNNKDIYGDYCSDNKELLNAFIGWDEMRKKLKKPLTDRAKELSITALEKLSKNPDKQIKIIEQSTLRDWQSFFELKEGEKKTKKAVMPEGDYAD